MHDWIDRLLARFGYLRATQEQLDTRAIAGEASSLSVANAELARMLELAGVSLAQALAALRDSNHPALADALARVYDELLAVYHQNKK